jgi:hypothetical protein
MIDKEYAELSVVEKKVSEEEKKINNDEYIKNFFNAFRSFEKKDTFPDNIKDGEIIRYKDSVLIKEEDNYYLAEKRVLRKILNTDEILKNDSYKELIANYIQKKPLSKTEIEKTLKEEMKKEGLKYDRKKSFEENVEVLLLKGNIFARKINEEFEFEKETGVRVKPKSLSLEDVEKYKNFLKELNEILKSDELNIVKISQIKFLMYQIKNLKDEIKDEIVKNKENFEKSPFISLSNLLKLNNKKPLNEMELVKETLSNSLAKDENLVKKINAEIDSKEILVIFKPFKSLKEIEELLNVKKDFIQQKNAIDNSKYNII